MENNYYILLFGIITVQFFNYNLVQFLGDESMKMILESITMTR